MKLRLLRLCMRFRRIRSFWNSANSSTGAIYEIALWVRRLAILIYVWTIYRFRQSSFILHKDKKWHGKEGDAIKGKKKKSLAVGIIKKSVRRWRIHCKDSSNKERGGRKVGMNGKLIRIDENLSPPPRWNAQGICINLRQFATHKSFRDTYSI